MSSDSPFPPSSSADGAPSIEQLLLDWHLNRMDDSGAAWIEKELSQSADLQFKNDNLRRILEPLDALQAPPAGRLAENVLNFVRSASGENGGTQAPERRAVPTSAPVDRGPRIFPFVRFREMVAVAACFVVLVGISVPTMSELRGRAQRTACADNLSAIYRGLSAYQSSFGGALPYAGSANAAAWLPGSTGSSASNSRHAFLLAKLGFVSDDSDFVCGGSDVTPTEQRAVHASAADFASPANISYDTINLAGAGPNLRPSPTVAYIGDRNPLFLQARFNDLLDPDRTNSPSHRRKGQNVLTLSGAAQFVRSPIIGEAKDNLWLADGIRKYTGTETPAHADDSFLVPGFSTSR